MYFKSSCCKAFWSVYHYTGCIFIACSWGTYSLDCAQTCGNCENNETCNNVDGSCTGCVTGYLSHLCKGMFLFCFSLPVYHVQWCVWFIEQNESYFKKGVLSDIIQLHKQKMQEQILRFAKFCKDLRSDQAFNHFYLIIMLCKILTIKDTLKCIRWRLVELTFFFQNVCLNDI